MYTQGLSLRVAILGLENDGNIYNLCVTLVCYTQKMIVHEL